MTRISHGDRENEESPFRIVDGRSDRARAIDAEIRAWAETRKKRRLEQCDVLIIKKRYPNEKHLELFARRRKNSWDVWAHCTWGRDDYG